MKKINNLILLSLTFLPALTSAQNLTKTKTLLESVGDIVANVLVPIAFTLGLVYFFWGVAKYIRSAGEEKEEGKKIMLWGIIGLFVMTSIWGIVAFLRSELGIGTNTNMQIPTIGGTQAPNNQSVNSGSGGDMDFSEWEGNGG